MKRFLHCFLAFWRGFAPVVEMKYDEGDRMALSLFLKSRAGALLMANLKAQSFEQDRQATLENKDPRWNAGAACGFRLCVALISSFSVVPTVEEDEYETIPGRSGENRFAQNTR